MRCILFDSWGHSSHFSNLWLSSHYMFPGHLLFALHNPGLSIQFAWAPLDPSQGKTTLTLLTPPTNWCFPGLCFIVWTYGSMFLPLTKFSYSDSSFRPINVGKGNYSKMMRKLHTHCKKSNILHSHQVFEQIKRWYKKERERFLWSIMENIHMNPRIYLNLVLLYVLESWWVLERALNQRLMWQESWPQLHFKAH